MEKLNEYIQADKTNEQSVETLYADLQHRFSVMKARTPPGRARAREAPARFRSAGSARRAHARANGFGESQPPTVPSPSTLPPNRRTCRARTRTAAGCGTS